MSCIQGGLNVKERLNNYAHKVTIEITCKESWNSCSAVTGRFYQICTPNRKGLGDLSIKNEIDECYKNNFSRFWYKLKTYFCFLPNFRLVFKLFKIISRAHTMTQNTCFGLDFFKIGSMVYIIEASTNTKTSCKTHFFI